MSPSQRHPEFVLLVAAVLLWGCGSTQRLPSSTPAPGPALSTTSPSVSTATTTPSGGPIEPAATGGGQIDEGDAAGLDEADPLLNHVVVTVSDGLRVRSEPRVSDDSIKYEPVLPLGTELTVLDGPVSASGYWWYEVAPVSFAGLDGPGFGWVALAGKDGEPWIALGNIDCPPVPTDVRTVVNLPLDTRLACFSGRPITFRARLIECNCDVDGGSYEPAWFGGGSQPLLLVEPSQTRPPDDYNEWLIVRFDPAGRYPVELPVGDLAEVAGMFDHPGALDCLYQGVPDDVAGPPAPTSDCRFMFVTTSLAAAQP